MAALLDHSSGYKNIDVGLLAYQEVRSQHDANMALINVQNLGVCAMYGVSRTEAATLARDIGWFAEYNYGYDPLTVAAVEGRPGEDTVRNIFLGIAAHRAGSDRECLVTFVDGNTLFGENGRQLQSEQLLARVLLRQLLEPSDAPKVCTLSERPCEEALEASSDPSDIVVPLIYTGRHESPVITVDASLKRPKIRKRKA